MTHHVGNRIETAPADMGDVSDGYHTFNELYEHRTELFRLLCRWLQPVSWRSRLHSDGTMFEGFFVAGIETVPGSQITYHIPIAKWDDFAYVSTYPRAPKWDGHTAADVVERLKRLG